MPWLQAVGYGMLALAAAAAGCPQKKGTETSGSTSVTEGGEANGGAGTTGGSTASGSETAPARQTSPDGRLQALDSLGNPVFDAAGNPVWEQTSAEKAKQLFEEAVALRNGVGGQPGSPQACVDRLREATQLQPQLAEAWYDRGLCELELNLLPEAQASLSQATRLRPAMTDAWLSLGIAYEREGKLLDATRAYAAGLDKKADDVGLMNGMARVYRKQGKPDLAAQKAMAVLRVNSNSLDAYITLGLAYRDAKEFELARFVLMKAEQSVPDGDKSGAIQNNLGLVYGDLGQEFEAERRFQRAREIDPKDVGAMVNLAHLKLKNLDFSGARELLEEAHRVLPASVPIQLNLAVARRGTGDVDGARRVYEEIAAQPGEYEDDALLNLGILYGDFVKDYTQAIDSYRAYISARERQGQPVAADDPVHEYIKEAEKIKAREEKKKQQKGAAASPAPAPAAGAAP